MDGSGRSALVPLVVGAVLVVSGCVARALPISNPDLAIADQATFDRAAPDLGCPTGWANCNGISADGCEQRLDTLAHCGACDTPCGPLAHATATCSTGVCDILACEMAHANCDGVIVNGCEPMFSFFIDSDGDGHGGPNLELVCPLNDGPPAGYTAQTTDCYDGNAAAFPGQSLFFAVHRGDGSFDYDCDQQSTPRWPSINPALCVCWSEGCGKSEGWVSVVPGCGVVQDFSYGTNPQTCDLTIAPRPQECR